jgi:hypothetical protein
MSDSIDSDISPKGFGTFSDKTTNSESTPGDKYSRQVGDSVTVQDGNKSVYQNGWLNTVTTGFEFKTIAGTSVTTIGGGKLDVNAGVKTAVMLLGEVDVRIGDTHKIGHGEVYEWSKQKTHVWDSDKRTIAKTKRDIADKSINIFGEVYEYYTDERKTAAETVELIAGKLTYESKGQASFTAEGSLDLSSKSECKLSSEGIVTIKGSLATEIDSSGDVTIKGKTVNLN